MKRCTSLLAMSLLMLPACGDSSGGDRGDEASSTNPATSLGTESMTDTDPTSTSTTDPSTGTGTDTMAEGTDTEKDCGESEVMLEATPPNIVMVLDKSGSMVSNSWDHDNDGMTPDITRWNSLYNVVDLVANNFNDSINFGVVLFPSVDAQAVYGQGACTVNMTPEVPVASMNAAAVLSGIPGAMDTNLEGATPATKGIETAVDHLVTLDPMNERFMILVTDGAANCGSDAMSNTELMENYDTNLPIRVGEALNDDSIGTFVVGIDILDELQGVGIDGAPEANTFQELNTVADAGGHARPGPEKFYNATDEQELNDAFTEIAGETCSCIIALDPAPDIESVPWVEIEVPTGTPVANVNGDPPLDLDVAMDCGNSDGWRYTNMGGPYDAIELCGAACTALCDTGDLKAIYGCPPIG